MFGNKKTIYGIKKEEFNFAKSILDLDEKQLLRLIAIMIYETQYDTLVEENEELINIAKGMV